MTEHELKTHPTFFGAVLSGLKTYELRRDDRKEGYHFHDILLLREWDPLTRDYTGRQLRARVTYVLDIALVPGMTLDKRTWVCMSIEVLSDAGGARA